MTTIKPPFFVVWHKVNERRPEPGVPVLGWAPGVPGMRIMTFSLGYGWMEGDYYARFSPTHWTELPIPPLYIA